MLACRTSRTTGEVCRTVDHSMASIFCGHAEKHIIKWSASSVSLVLEQKRAQTRHSLKQKKKRIKSWSMELQMLQILQLAVWDFVFCSKSSTSAWRRMIKDVLEHGAIYAKFFSLWSGTCYLLKVMDFRLSSLEIIFRKRMLYAWSQ